MAFLHSALRRADRVADDPHVHVLQVDPGVRITVGPDELVEHVRVVDIGGTDLGNRRIVGARLDGGRAVAERDIVLHGENPEVVEKVHEAHEQVPVAWRRQLLLELREKSEAARGIGHRGILDRAGARAAPGAAATAASGAAAAAATGATAAGAAGATAGARAAKARAGFLQESRPAPAGQRENPEGEGHCERELRLHDAAGNTRGAGRMTGSPIIDVAHGSRPRVGAATSPIPR